MPVPIAEGGQPVLMVSQHGLFICFPAYIYSTVTCHLSQPSFSLWPLSQSRCYQLVVPLIYTQVRCLRTPIMLPHTLKNSFRDAPFTHRLTSLLV